MEDSPKPKSKGPSKWKRPPTRVYDYNYDVGQHYYKPMLNHLDKKGSGASVDPPGPTTFAERLAVDPLYGRLKPLDKVSVAFSLWSASLDWSLTSCSCPAQVVGLHARQVDAAVHRRCAAFEEVRQRGAAVWCQWCRYRVDPADVPSDADE